ncbi:hypothetical protein FZC84_10240 [Rossellomorea vietnamensis]|uniref:Uncharacterized protein n=1 Tax=Rossellomorea vietnamensis TaxID=218284 RepID=A0A5D4MF41_9BACI|nr:DUF5365 family protein [Rossellomorea vietnamensis]TYR99600.1 hypothetical protein FZC84_10240 [Rossellomorea vietnamensis]
MKILLASTEEQEETIQELITYIYCTIFPRYFTDDEIEQFEQLEVLHTDTDYTRYNGTLKEAFQVISSLQTLISLIETDTTKSDYEEMYDHNLSILKSFNLFFPFNMDHFREYCNYEDKVSVYAKPANQLLV